MIKYNMLLLLEFREVGGGEVVKTAWREIFDLAKIDKLRKSGKLPNSYVISFEGIPKKEILLKCKEAEKKVIEDLRKQAINNY